MRARSLVVLATALLVLVAGCSCGPTGGGGGRRDTGVVTGVDGGGTTTNETGAQCLDRLDNDLDGLADCADPDCAPLADCIGFDGGPRADVPLEGCAGATFDGENLTAPVDIVWVIDNSGSMGEETTLVQMNMQRFADAITSSGVDDYRVVVLTSPALVLSPPLGTDTVRYLALDANIQSNDGFQRTIEEFPRYRDFLRPEAFLHFVFVTDDESDMMSTSFQSQMRSLLGRDFYGHAIASPTTGPPVCIIPGVCIPAPGCMGPYGNAPAGGRQYELLATASGGVFANICSASWTPVFDALLATIAVARPLPCNFAIPDPPPGETFDRNLVNVVYTPSGGVATTIPRSADDCASGSGWRYDNPTTPTEIILCASNCAVIEADPGGSINIQLGCETLIF